MYSGYSVHMLLGIDRGLTGVEAAAALAASAARHVGWWLEWQVRAGFQAGTRELTEMDLGSQAVRTSASS
jgi:hypothetical protein